MHFVEAILLAMFQLIIFQIYCICVNQKYQMKELLKKNYFESTRKNKRKNYN